VNTKAADAAGWSISASPIDAAEPATNSSLAISRNCLVSRLRPRGPRRRPAHACRDPDERGRVVRSAGSDACVRLYVEAAALIEKRAAVQRLAGPLLSRRSRSDLPRLPAQRYSCFRPEGGASRRRANADALPAIASTRLDTHLAVGRTNLTSAGRPTDADLVHTHPPVVGVDYVGDRRYRNRPRAVVPVASRDPSCRQTRVPNQANSTPAPPCSHRREARGVRPCRA